MPFKWPSRAAVQEDVIGAAPDQAIRSEGQLQGGKRGATGQVPCGKQGPFFASRQDREPIFVTGEAGTRQDDVSFGLDFRQTSEQVTAHRVDEMRRLFRHDDHCPAIARHAGNAAIAGFGPVDGATFGKFPGDEGSRV